jgi:hypothetical protein
MPTINAVVNQASMVSHLSTKFFNGNREAANQSLLVGPGYGNFFNFLTSEFGGQPALTNLVENYSNNRETFSENFRENLEALQESSEKVKESATPETSEDAEVATVKDTDNDKNTGAALSTLGEFAAGNIPPELRNLANIPLQPADDPKPETPPKITNALQTFAQNYLTADKIRADVVENVTNINGNTRVSAIQNLVHNFNSAISYLYENRSVSDLMSALVDKFGNNQNLSASLNSIGISMNAQGFLSLNEGIFNSALANDSDSVNSILGSEGLTGQLEKNIDLANFQSDKLFTSIMDFAGKNARDDSESLYGNNANYAKENSPRLFTMFT